MVLKKTVARCLGAFIPIRTKRKEFRRRFSGGPSIVPARESALAHNYLDGLNGIEIGASTQNDFGLRNAGGAYATVDFDPTQGGKWQTSGFAPAQVNIVANGDDLPFKDESLDYVLSSHVIEHCFDPIKALEEWLRVVKKGGYLFIIVPHKERTFDRNRDITPLDELINRHNGILTIHDYAYMQTKEANNRGYGAENQQVILDTPHLLIANQEILEGWTRFEQDDHHHWSAWTTKPFLELCRHLQLNIVEVQDPDDKVGNGFTVVIQKT